MIDTTTESVITLAEAARDTAGRRLHLSTVHRWRLRGVAGVKLETVLIGGRRYTSREALQRFFARSTAARDGQHIPEQSPTHREKAIRDAELELSRAGI